MRELYNAISIIQSGWSASNIRFLLNYTELGAFFNRSSTQGNSINLYDFMKAYLKSSLYFRLWFKSYILGKSLQSCFDKVTLSFKLLHNNGIVNKDNFNILLGDQVSYGILSAIYILKDFNFITREHLLSVVRHANPFDLEDGLHFLNKAHMLTPENFMAVVEHASPFSSARALVILNKADMLLTQNNRANVLSHGKPACLAAAFVALKQNDLWTEEHCNAVTMVELPDLFAHALVTLKNADLLTRNNRDTLFEHNRAKAFANGLITLSKAGILTQNNILILASLERATESAKTFVDLSDAQFWVIQPENIADMLVILNKDDLLTEENRRVLLRHANPSKLTFAVRSLKNDGFLTQDAFTAVAKRLDPFCYYAEHLAEGGLDPKPSNKKMTVGSIPTSIPPGLRDHGIFAGTTPPSVAVNTVKGVSNTDKMIPSTN